MCVLTSNTTEVAVGEAFIIPLCIVSISEVALSCGIVNVIVLAEIVVKSELGNVYVTNSSIAVNVLDLLCIKLVVFLSKLDDVRECLGYLLTIKLILVYKLYKILVLAAGSILCIASNGNSKVVVCIILGKHDGIALFGATLAATGEYELAGSLVILAGPVGIIVTDRSDNLLYRIKNSVALGATGNVVVRTGYGVGRSNSVLCLNLAGLVSKKLILHSISRKLCIASLAIHNLIVRSALCASRSNLILINGSKRGMTQSRNLLMTEGGLTLGTNLVAKTVLGTGSFLGNLPSIACMFTGCCASHVN
jgi:hypothetical protein